MATPRELPPLARLIRTLREEEIRFQIVGMSAAILQGVPATTLDTDIWIDLPPRQYMRAMNLCVKLGGRMLANTVAALSDESMINFVYEVTGLRSFAAEYRQAERVHWLGEDVAVLPLRRILTSKQAIKRPKDLAHVPLLKETIRLKRHLKRAPHQL